MCSALHTILYFQVSYLIVDQAEEDADLVADPFLAAGIIIPSDLPNQEKSSDNGKNENKEDRTHPCVMDEENAVPLVNLKI